MQPGIINAKDKPLGAASANLPDLSVVVMSFLYPMTFEFTQTTLVNGYSQIVPIKLCTQGCIQPFTPQMLKVKPEGQRNWSWFTVHSLTDVNLNNNDRVLLDGVKYKVMEKVDWSRDEYYEYHMILDYEGCP